MFVDVEFPPAMHALLIRARAWLCAVPILEVIETLRPLPVEPIAGAPPFVLGVAIVRGAPAPVVSLAALLGAPGGARGARFVMLRTAQGRVALEVDEVLGARHLDTAALAEAPPLVKAALREHVELVGQLDGGLFALLRSSQLLPADLASGSSV